MNYNPLIDIAIIALFLIPVAIIALKGENKTGATLARRKAIIRHQAERKIRMEEMK
jgi:hypothetical protein